ncbi:MAG TPA: PEP-CTERM sorting domain-containing protein [Candidatus Paceibacterota bacterium]|nr:PEP-CTERM sorting domain-containing protein [Candidatus Paceibacterota bacterium]
MNKITPTTIAAVVMLSASQLLAATIWSDDFESYADTAALSPTYTQIYPTYPMLLDTTKGYNSSKSIHFGLTTANSQARAYFNLPGGPLTPSDGAPVKVEFMVDLDTAIWSTRQYIELRSYSGGSYNSGTLNQLFALGFTSSGVDTTLINQRILSGTSAGWGNLSGAYTRAMIANPDNNWTKLGMVIYSSKIEYYVNDSLDSSKPISGTYAFDSVVIGSGLSSAGADVWFDNLTVAVVPEPSSLALALVGGIGLLVARMRRQ